MEEVAEANGGATRDGEDEKPGLGGDGEVGCSGEDGAVSRKIANSFYIKNYVALTYVPEGELLTGFAMRSDPNVVFG